MNRKLRLEQLEERKLLAAITSYDEVDAAYFSGAGFGNSSNTAPTIVQPITLTGGNIVTGTSVTASFLANDDRGESRLRYTWTVLKAPEFPLDATITFSRNGTNAAKNVTMSFTTHGEYEVMVTAMDAKGLTVSDRLAFTVARNAVRVNLTSDTTGNMFPSTQRQYFATVLDQFGQTMNVPVRWSVNTSTAGTVDSNGLYTAGTRLGTFSVRATVDRAITGTTTGSASVTVIAAPVLTSLIVTPNDSALDAGGTQQYEAKAYDQYGSLMNISATWTATGGTVDDNGLYTAGQVGGVFTVTGKVTYNGVSLEQTLNVTINATAPILTTVVLTPKDQSVEVNKQQQYNVIAYDQYNNVINGVVVTWSATGGTIDSNGLFTAGNTIGAFNVKAIVQYGNDTFEENAVVNVTWPSGKPTLLDKALEQLVDSYYTDLFLSREEMIAILRSTGDEAKIDSNELADIRMMVTTTWYVMPDHVRALARNVVSSNNANLRYKGQAAGNLVDGSTETHLNNLIDKWFLGTDLPVAGSNLTYVMSTGQVFNGPLVLNHARQGYLGDCYFLASIVSIAGKNPERITGMFIDNGDDTYTIRWFRRDPTGAATPTYVTVNKMLPTSGGNLYYAGLGQNALSTATVLWAALLEKAYAQWNETGEAGRNGTNTYSGIEGGWMHNVNFQSLGFNSTNYSFSSSTETTFRNELLAGKAVTVGTKSSVASGWVAGHAYIVTLRSDGLYDLTNPWGYNHRLGVTWNEIVTNCTIFTSTLV